jgi:hypothetical protein
LALRRHRGVGGVEEGAALRKGRSDAYGGGRERERLREICEY